MSTVWSRLANQRNEPASHNYTNTAETWQDFSRPLWQLVPATHGQRSASHSTWICEINLTFVQWDFNCSISTTSWTLWDLISMFSCSKRCGRQQNFGENRHKQCNQRHAYLQRYEDYKEIFLSPAALPLPSSFAKVPWMSGKTLIFYKLKNVLLGIFMFMYICIYMYIYKFIFIYIFIYLSIYLSILLLDERIFF